MPWGRVQHHHAKAPSFTSSARDSPACRGAAYVGAKKGAEKGSSSAASNPAPPAGPPTAPPPPYYGAPPPPAYYTAAPGYAPAPPAGTGYYVPAPAPVYAPAPAPVCAAPAAPAPAAPSPQAQPSSPKALLLNPKEIKKWDAKTVLKFLETIDTPSAVIEKFAEAGVTGEDLLECTADDLKEDLGIGRLQARKIIRSLGLTEDDSK